MNRLILVGNGFDLAHGLKTSYQHFIDDFWVGQFTEINEDSKSYTNFENGILRIKNKENIWKLPLLKDFNEFLNFIESQNEHYKQNNTIFEIKNLFLKQITNLRSHQNWVDIEDAYYNNLKKIEIGNINKLNEDFEEVKESFVKYLKKIEKNISTNKIIQNKFYSLFNVDDFTTEIKIKFISQIKELLEDLSISDLNQSQFLKNLKHDFANSNMLAINNFFQNLNKYNRDEIKKIFPIFKPKAQLILNFNYTETTNNYKDFNYIDIISIHGKLDSVENPIIFGFGDDVDKKHQDFEDLNDNRYLKNFKSIAYLQTDNYKKLLEFINAEEYQVFIFGHSCGISDRTMLNTIFEHDNCKSIKPFYYLRGDGTDNYTELVQNISRNFNDKKKFRDRVVNKTYCQPLI